ncbi:MAG TPA: right-handed parallel beta-helix repeat-containing protein [Pyrinomonadaceae bacterium]|nr:right-handed parallel beta-helix repeat-containing protein [Pyrinomonadaceae bacterium]
MAALALLALALSPFALPPAAPRVAAQNSGTGTALELIPSGSLVIPMDNSLQAIGAPFNLRAYGLVERLLWAGVPVKWAIAAGKAKDGVDFTATAARIQPTAAGAASLNFSGGPFVVHRDFAVAALSVVNAYAPGASVAVYQTTADVNVQIRHTLSHRPKVAVFDDGGSAIIHTNYLAAAGFISGTHYDVIPAATLVTVNASACFTIGTEPHWDGAGGSDAQVNAVRQFIQSGGNFLAECEGVTTYENNVNFGRYQTTNGFVEGNVRTGIQYPNPDLPYSQFVGAMADVGGSVRDFQPAAGGTYRATAELHARSPSGSIGGGAAGVLPAKGTVARLGSPSAGGFVFYLGGHEYNTTALDNINGVRMYLNAVMTPTARPSNCNLTLTPRTLSGFVYEDINGDSQLGDASPRANVAVRLYQDANNNGTVDAADTYLSATTTNASGAYSFQVAPQANGNNFLVAVNSKNVAPTAGLIAGRGDVWAEQTYGDDPATAAFDLGSRFGGRAAGTSDNFNTASTTPANNNYQHVARVDVSAGNVTNANFAFSFNVVTNTRGGDAADDDASSTTRTVQGSLRQFIQNANAVNGANAMRFVPGAAAAATGGGGTYWQIAVTSALPAVVDSSTTLDGTAYQHTNGTSLRDTNTGSLGTGGTVGTDALALPQVARPELEVFDNAGIALGFDLQASDSTVRRFALYGFGTTANSDASAQIRVGNVTGALVEENVIGSTAATFADPGAATRSVGDGVRVVSGDGGTVRNNLVGFSSGKGIQLGTGAAGWTVTGNEVRGNGINNSNLDGLDVENSGTATVRGNLFVGNEAAGVDMYQSSGSNTVENNTITGNGVGAGANIESPGVRVFGASNTVARNVVSANFGAGVMVTSGATSNVITRNSIFANGTIANKAGAAASNQIGIDLLSAADSLTVGTSPFVTPNDNGDGDAGANGLANLPVLTSARILGSNLTLTGYARPGAAVEFFVAAPDPSGFGEGQTYLLTLAEGSAADTDNTTGTYTSPVNGLNVGTDTTNLFRFVIPLPSGVAVGTALTATATLSGSTSEFSGNVVVQNAPPEITLEKRCTSPADCETARQAPGTELTYTITFTNSGGSAAQNFTLLDVIPFSVDAAASTVDRSTEFKVGSTVFTPGTSGLTLPAGGVLHFSDAISYPPPTPPWNPTASYTPGGAAGTFDPAVSYVGWQFTGSMPPNTSGSISFTVRIR